MKKLGTVAVVAGSVAFAALILLATARPSVANAPSGRFMASGGTIIDAKTGLVWQLVVPSGTYTWADAGPYCTSNAASLPGLGWRLPSMKELQTIVDDSRSVPSIDPIFSSTPGDYFWTSSTYAPSMGYAWAIRFTIGGAASIKVDNGYRVRCVR